MYLSRIQLTEAIGGSSQLGLLLANNSYGMHRLLWDLFDKTEQGRFLYREEDASEQLGSSYRRPVYYVISHSPPCHESPLFVVDTKSFEPSLSQGDRLGFRVRVNPTVARRAQGEKHSKRHDVIMDAQFQWLSSACAERGIIQTSKKGDMKRALLQHPDFQGKSGLEHLDSAVEKAVEEACDKWLSDRATKNGFELVTQQSSGYRWNALPEKGRHAGFSSLDYEGVLTVTDPALFLSSLSLGFGPAKAFGCGLMLIRRI